MKESITEMLDQIIDHFDACGDRDLCNKAKRIKEITCELVFHCENVISVKNGEGGTRSDCWNLLSNAIMAANGGGQEVLSGHVGARLWDSQWLSIVDHDYSGLDDDDKIAKAIKLTEQAMARNILCGLWPSVWKSSPPWANYLAMDESGVWEWYENKPKPDDGCWWDMGKSQVHSQALGWKDSLQERT